MMTNPVSIALLAGQEIFTNNTRLAGTLYGLCLILLVFTSIALFGPFEFQIFAFDQQDFISRWAAFLVPVTCAVMAMGLIIAAEKIEKDRTRMIIFVELALLLSLFFILPAGLFFSESIFASSAGILAIGAFLAAEICLGNKFGEA